MFSGFEELVYNYGYFAILGIMILGVVGLPLPEETLMLFCGFLAHEGMMSLPWVYAASLAGALLGKALSYYLGVTLGMRAARRWGPRLGITEERLERTHRWFEHAGRWAITFGYFVPFLRHLTGFVAGSSGLDRRTFALYAVPGGILWTAVYVAIGYFAGAAWQEAEAKTRTAGLAIAGIVVIIVAAFFIWRYVTRRRAAK